jgi:hypothetical protein
VNTPGHRCRLDVTDDRGKQQGFRMAAGFSYHLVPLS